MTFNREDFTDEEWQRVQRAPLVAGMAISLADPGGPIEALKESVASLKTLQRPVESGEHAEFVQEVSRAATERIRSRENPVSGFKPRDPEQIVSELQEVAAIVRSKAGDEDAASFRDWLVEAATEAANAAKEGGFMGFRAERVSQGEQDMLTRIGDALG